jgi:ribonuclease D
LGKTITKEDLSVYPAETFDGKIIEIQTASECEDAVRYLSGAAMLGFDTETRPAFKKGNPNNVALIQFSTHDACFLFRLNMIGIPASLTQLLSNPKVLKIGLSLRDDFHNLGRRLKFTPQGFVDLQHIVKDYGIDDLSLQKIYALLFQKKISKAQRLTNWEAPLLTEPQKCYAALDAWACLKIYEELCLAKKST